MIDPAIKEIFTSIGLDFGEDDVVRYPQVYSSGTEMMEYLQFTDDSTAVTPEGEVLDLQKIESVYIWGRDRSLGIRLEGVKKPIVVSPGLFNRDTYSSLDNTITVKVPKARKMPKTDSELNDLFPTLYPDYKSKMYYDVLRERECIDLSMFDASKRAGQFVDYSEEIEYLYYDNIERRLRDIGCEGLPPSTQVRFRVLMTKFYQVKRNLFKEWVMSHKWDGRSRVDTWFQTVFGATAPPLSQVGLDNLYLAKVARAWFVGAINRMDREISHEIVPVLIGPQGFGKSTGLRYTAAKPEWFIDTTVDVSQASGVRQFLDAARGHIIIEMAESTQIRTKDQESLKAFISKSSDQYRKPYKKKEESFPRHFILAATSNLDDVFTDLTGNRRYYPIYCHRTDRSNRTQYDVEQVWAEAYEMAKRGEQYFISSDWYPAVVMQEYATLENSNVSTIDNWLDNPDNGYAFIGAMISKDEVFYNIFGVSSALPSPAQETAWRAWTKGTRKWVRVEYPVKSRLTKRSTRAYQRICLDDGRDTPVAVECQFNQQLYDECLASAQFSGFGSPLLSIDSDLDPKYRELSPESVFKLVCKEHDIKNEFEEFPTEGLSEKMIRAIFDLGLIYFEHKEGIYKTILILA